MNILLFAGSLADVQTVQAMIDAAYKQIRKRVGAGGKPRTKYN